MSINEWVVTNAVLPVADRVLLFGPPGTGKTYIARTAGLVDNQKVYQLTMTPETPMAEIRGHFVQKGGEFVWHDGPGTRAWREGARLIINEIDRAGEDVLSLLYALMDDPAHAELTLPTGETIRPHANFNVVCTMNGELEDLPDALQDRLAVSIQISEINPEALKKFEAKYHDAIKNTAATDNPARRVSIRAWAEFFSLLEKGVEKPIALKAVFGRRASTVNEALVFAGIDEEAEPETLDGIDLPGTYTMVLMEEALELSSADSFNSEEEWNTWTKPWIEALTNDEVTRAKMPTWKGYARGEMWIDLWINNGPRKRWTLEDLKVKDF